MTQIAVKNVKNNSLSLKKERLKIPMFDIPFFIVVMLLLLIGLAMLFSAGYAKALSEKGDSYYFINRQLFAAALGIIAMLIISFIQYNFYTGLTVPAYFICVFLLVLVLIIGPDSEKRWLYIGSFQFQPSELAKISVIMLIAEYLSKLKPYSKKIGETTLTTEWRNFKDNVLIPSAIFGVCAILILVETHLSGAILVMAVGIILLVASGCKMRYLLPIGVTGVIAAIIAIFFTDYMQARLYTWMHPEENLSGDAFQISQSLYTIGSGGLFGLGYGRSRQKYLYLPEPQNDFIFSIVCEELGYIGAIFIIGLFAILIWRGVYIAINAPNKFTSLVVVGIISHVAVQTAFNLAVVTNTVPVTGVALPFFSYGGTALLVLLVEMGIVLQISRYSFIDKGD